MENLVVDDPELKRKVRLILQSREQLAKENDELKVKLAELSTSETSTQPISTVQSNVINCNESGLNSDIKLQIGQIFLDAERSAAQLITDAKIESEKINNQNKLYASGMLDKIDSLKEEIKGISEGFDNVTNSFNGKISEINQLLSSIEERFNKQ